MTLHFEHIKHILWAKISQVAQRTYGCTLPLATDPVLVTFLSQEADRLRCATSVLHQTDQACRRLISEAMKTAKGLAQMLHLSQLPSCSFIVTSVLFFSFAVCNCRKPRWTRGHETFIHSTQSNQSDVSSRFTETATSGGPLHPGRGYWHWTSGEKSSRSFWSAKNGNSIRDHVWVEVTSSFCSLFDCSNLQH